jgi:hypothetical protein
MGELHAMKRNCAGCLVLLLMLLIGYLQSR